jgi:hypothetical protein
MRSLDEESDRNLERREGSYHFSLEEEYFHPLNEPSVWSPVE